MKRGIRWYKKLYVGPSLEGLKRTMRYEIKYHRIPVGYYLITLPSTDNNVFDIWPSEQIKMPWMRKKILDVVGIAGSKQEACELAGKMIYEAYRAAGTVDMKTYLGYR